MPSLHTPESTFKKNTNGGEMAWAAAQKSYHHIERFPLIVVFFRAKKQKT